MKTYPSAGIACCMLQLAKFIFHSESRVRVGTGEQPYIDIPVVRELRVVLNQAVVQHNSEPERSDVSLKWLEWPDFLELVRKLKEAAELRVRLRSLRSLPGLSA